MYNDYAKIMSESQYKTKYGEGLKILTPKQMLQRLAIVLAQVKACSNSKNLLSEIRQIAYSLYQSKEITNINIKKDTIFMNSGNSKNSKPHVLILMLIDKLDLRRSEKIVALSSVSIYYAWKNIKKSYNNNKFKISAPT